MTPNATHPAVSREGEVEREAFTIAEFCRSIGISRAFFYKLHEDQLPRVIRLGRRVLITREAAADWRRARLESASRAESPQAETTGGAGCKARRRG